MKVLSITEPVRIAAIGGTLPLVSRLLEPNPRESSGRAPNLADYTIDVDFGDVINLDTLFLGYVYAGQYPALRVSYGASDYTTSALPNVPVAPSLGSEFRHYFVQLDTPIRARYVRMTINATVGATFGCFAAGVAFSPEFGHEYGAGRFITDTGAATRLQDGSFGIDEGVGVGGYGWTFGDLSKDETDALYLIQRRRRSTKSVLVVEDPELYAGLSERIHWGLFTKLQAYERFAPGATKWSLTVDDWA